MEVTEIVCIFARNMDYDIPESVSQRSSGEETAENRRILEVADELRRCCELYEAQLRNGEEHVSRLEVEQRFANDEFVVWDLVPRNVLRDKEGDIFIIDAEIAKNQ